MLLIIKKQTTIGFIGSRSIFINDTCICCSVPVAYVGRNEPFLKPVKTHDMHVDKKQFDNK